MGDSNTGSERVTVIFSSHPILIRYFYKQKKSNGSYYWHFKQVIINSSKYNSSRAFYNKEKKKKKLWAECTMSQWSSAGTKGLKKHHEDMAMCRFKTAWPGLVEQKQVYLSQRIEYNLSVQKQKSQQNQHLAFSIPITCFEDRDHSCLAPHLQSFSVSVSRKNNCFPTLHFIYALFPSQCFFFPNLITA